MLRRQRRIGWFSCALTQRDAAASRLDQWFSNNRRLILDLLIKLIAHDHN
jgi:hypothetical protein